MSPREKVGGIIADALAAILERAFKDTGRWDCSARASIERMRAKMNRAAGGLTDEEIARLELADPEEVKAYIRAQIEPAFRREIAKDLLS